MKIEGIKNGRLNRIDQQFSIKSVTGLSKTVFYPTEISFTDKVLAFVKIRVELVKELFFTTIKQVFGRLAKQ